MNLSKRKTLRKKIKKHMPILLCIFGIILFTTCGGNVFAQSIGDTATPDIFDSVKLILGVILNIIYIIIWPILVLAGTAMDNTLVYGGFINLDKPLFSLRNISRTFANFLLVAILISELIKMSSGGTVDKKKVIISLFTAAIGINASRFLLGALLDISTVATYGIGALPMTTLNQVRQEKMPIMMIHSYLNLSTNDTNKPQSTGPTGSLATNEDITTSLVKYNDFINNHIYYSWGSVTIPTCEVHKGYIIGATQYPYILDKNGKPMSGVDFSKTCPPGSSTCDHLYCALGPTIAVDLNGLETKKREVFYTTIKNSIDSNIDANQKENEVNRRTNKELSIIIDHISGLSTGCTTVTGTYNSIPKKDIENISSVLIGTNISDKGKKICGQVINDVASASSFMNIINNNSSMQGQGGLFLEELMEKSQGLVGPLVTIYVSILDFSNITSVSDTMKDTTSAGVIIEFIMKALASIFMIIPLITLALVLLMRVGILWAIIAFSPFLVVLWTFKDSSIVSSISGATENYTKPGAVIGLIFAPVVPVFALGIGMIIIQTIQLRMHEGLGQSQSTWGFLGVNFQATGVDDGNGSNNETCADFWGLTELCYDTGSDTKTGSIYNDLFGRIILNILAIGIMRAIVKASFAASSITSSIATKTMDLGTSLLGSIPFIRIPGSGGAKLSASNLLKIPNTIDNVTRSKFENMNHDGELAIQKLEDSFISNNNPPTNKTVFQSLSDNTKKSVANDLKTGDIRKIDDIKKTITTSATNSQESSELIKSINNMTGDELEAFIKEIEGIDEPKKTRLTSIIQKDKKLDEIKKDMATYINDGQKIKNMDMAEEFLRKFNDNPEKQKLIEDAATDNHPTLNTILGENIVTKIEGTNEVIKYDRTSRRFIRESA